MSTPINHHYVSQCHIRYFYNETEKLIHCYDKKLNNYYSKSSIKTIFSEDLSNSRFDNNEINHKILEDQLNNYFEKDFPKHANIIIEIANNPTKYNESVRESLYYLACYALIADARFPIIKKGIDESYNSVMAETAFKLRLLGGETEAMAIENSLKSEITKYSNILDYTDIAASRLDKMGSLDFNIIKINSSDSFILPDIGCILRRERINNYINRHLQEVAIFGIPLTSKVFLFGCSKKIGGTSSNIIEINDTNSEVVKNINAEMFTSAYKTIVAEDSNQLKEIIEIILTT